MKLITPKWWLLGRLSFLFLFSFLCITNIQYNFSQQIMIDLLEEAYPESFSNEIITKNEQDELSFDSMLRTLNRTQTFFGSWGLQRLTRPTSKRSDIYSAQKRLQLLLDNPELFDSITSLLSEIQKGQRSLLVYYNEDSRLSFDAQSLYYYYTPGSRHLNKNKLALDVSYLLSYTKLVGNQDLLMAIMGKMTNIAMTGNLSSLSSIFSLGNPIRSNTPWPVLLHDEALYKKCLKDSKIFQETYSQGSFGDRTLLINASALESYQSVFKQNLSTGLRVLALFVNQVFYDVGCASLGFKAYDRVKFLWRVMTELKHTTAQLARVIRAADELAELIDQYPELAQWKPLKPLTCLLSDSSYWSEDVHLLFEQLYDSTFDLGTSNYWYSRGRVLLAHKKMKEVCYDLGPLWSSLAHLDAQMSIARLYREQQETNNTFCFVELSEQEIPLASLQDFWFPLTYGELIVSNSIDMGTANFASKVVVTGPNGGGKSTVMKSICWSVILGQSWGIVPAKYATISLFTGLRTSLNPTEDIAKGLSTFMAEKARMTNIETFIAQNDSSACVLLALDEPYRGTVEVEAADRVCGFCESIAPDNRVALLLATHLEAPTYLEQQFNSFANCQMEFAQKDDGDVLRTFRLIPGAAQWWFNDAVRRKKIIESLGV